MKFLTRFAACLLSLSSTSGLHAEDGVSGQEILIGMSNVTSGATATLGTDLKLGAEVYLNKINAAGGVHGRKIKLLHKDDGYEPKQAVDNTRSFIETDKVFALFGYVGTPTSKAAVPLAEKAGVPFVAPFTGAEFLRSPVTRNVFNVRASYFDETEELVERFVTDLSIKDIAVFAQDDGYGDAGKAGLVKALKKRGLDLAGEGRYVRNTADIGEGLKAIKAKNPKAVVLVGTYKACAAFMKEAHKQGFKPIFANISFVGTSSLVADLGADGDGSFISQTMPHPEDSKLAIVSDFKKDMQAAGQKNLSYTALEGYVDAVVLVEALKKTGKDLTRKGFIDTLETFNQDIGGLKVGFAPDNHQGLRNVHLTQVKNGKVSETKSMKP